jgi:hypothetical protein
LAWVRYDGFVSEHSERSPEHKDTHAVDGEPERTLVQSFGHIWVVSRKLTEWSEHICILSATAITPSKRTAQGG